MFNTAVLYLTPVSPQSNRRSQGIGVSDSDDDEASDLIWVWSPARTTQHTWVCCCKQEFSISGLPATADREIHRQIFGRGLWSDCHPPSTHTHTHTHTQPHTLSRLLLLSTAVLIQYLVSFAFAAYVTITQDPKSSRSGLIIAAGPLRINLSLKCLKSARGFRCACQWLGVIFGAHTHTHTLSKLLCSCDRARRASLNAKAEGKNNTQWKLIPAHECFVLIIQAWISSLVYVAPPTCTAGPKSYREDHLSCSSAVSPGNMQKMNVVIEHSWTQVSDQILP